MVPWLGGLSDRWGRKPFIITGMAGYGISSLLFLYASSAESLIFTRLVQGVFAAMVLPVAMALVADITPPGMEGRAFGTFNMFFFMGFGIGPVIGGAVYDLAGLNANFLLMFALGLVAALTVALTVREPASEQRSGGKRGFREMLHLAHDHSFLAILVARGGLAAGMSSFTAFMPLVATGHGLDILGVGMCLTANVLLSTAMQRPAGWLADRLPRLPLAVGGLALAGVMKTLIPWGTDLFSLMLLCMAEGVFAGTSLPAPHRHGREPGQGPGHGHGAHHRHLHHGAQPRGVPGAGVRRLCGGPHRLQRRGPVAGRRGRRGLGPVPVGGLLLAPGPAPSGGVQGYHPP